MTTTSKQLSAEQLGRLADFCNEVGMLRHTPRSGYAFLGSGKENVAEHSYRVSVLGYALARLAGADPARVTSLPVSRSARGPHRRFQLRQSPL